MRLILMSSLPPNRRPGTIPRPWQFVTGNFEAAP